MQRTTSDKPWKNHENRSTFFSRGERFKSFFISQYIAPNKTVKQTPPAAVNFLRNNFVLLFRR